ncbi:MAG: hypothetical protein CVU09_04500 [Bacteroidetes bacterium HGW-Bacteroidetes-4]|jgi:hypothetical protein|nr:MAG: hypothetical protein CVU09_04500 [Bacteroidetes bacterium HGW-Bacteroidetes-4]
MKNLLILALSLCFFENAIGQQPNKQAQTKIMTLGVFHFAYHNLDAVKTLKEDQVSVFDEPYQSEIKAIANAICAFKPTHIAIELTPDQQARIDSLYALYLAGKFDLQRSEVYQLAFRIGQQSKVPTIYCVNDWGRHYDNIQELFADSIRGARLESYYLNSPDSVYGASGKAKKVTSMVNELISLNNPEQIKERLAIYLLNPFKYEEQAGDFTGVDFETGRWFNRNLRIFRNIQRIPHKPEDRILLIIGREHLNLLNPFFEVSKEFEWVSPLPYLESSRQDN